MALAKEGRQDEEAIQDLRRVAGRRRKDLLDAAAQARQGASIDEDRVTRLANNLLLAAAHGRLPVPVTPDEDAWFSMIDKFRDLPISEAFEQLAAKEPALRELERSMSGRASEIEPADLLAQGHVLHELHGALRSLVGPQSRNPDKLVVSQAAFDVAETHLADLAGLLEDGE